MRQDIEKIVLENLVSNIDFTRNVLPHISEEYFQDHIEQKIFKFVKDFFTKHHKLPNKKILGLFVEDYSGLDEDGVQAAHELVDGLDEKPEDNLEWLTEETEKFCKDRAIFNALALSLEIQDGNSKEFTAEAIPSILQKALSVCFDNHVGHDYLGDVEHRWEFYHSKENKIPFPIEIFNKITNGGVSNKTLNLYMMPPKVGKTLTMCNHVAYCIKNGYKALYITLEMAEERIAERVDANLMEMDFKELKSLDKDTFVSKFKDKYNGNLVIKEYPTCGGHVGHFRALLDELRLKKGFVPDIIFVDYLNICASQRMKLGGSVNSYTYIKSVGEELRGLAVEYNVPIISATQTNRDGANNTDLDEGDLSDSFGTAMSCDLLIAAMRTPELDELGQMMFKQLLSRYGDVNYYKKFVVGVNLKHFKQFDVIDSQQNLSDGGTRDNPPPISRNAVEKPKEMANYGGAVELEWD